MLKRMFSVEAVCAVLLVLIALLMSAQVFTRYVLHHPLTWSDEVVSLAFTWLCFLGAAVALKYRGHIGMSFLVDMCPPGPRRIWIALIGLVVSGFLALLVFAGSQMTLIVHDQLSAAMEIPMSVFYAALPVSAAWMIVHELLHVRAVWKESEQ